ncbi:MAG TPA: damage-inducible protein CinA [Erysipelotrichaceae bacterium]|nr:damage-inducible protein CinA [Erysipelotrichaceae bacterium]
MSENKKSLIDELKEFHGLPWWLYLGILAIAVLSMALGTVSNDLMTFILVAGSISIGFYKLGEILPVWNTYIGGGLLMVFFGTAILQYFHVIPEEYASLVGDMVQGDTNILTTFIVFLIVGSILALDRNILLRSFAGYVPAILGGLAGASLFGIAAGLLFGVSPADMLIKYVLPIMGGGNGAGAVPLSQLYEQVTGEPAASYYSFAIITLTIANLFCIVAGALLHRLGQKKPDWTGDGTNIMPVDQKLIKEDVKEKVTYSDYAGVLLLGGGVYAVGRLIAKKILPTILGAQIHYFAYVILFVVILAATGIIPKKMRVAAKNVQSFMTAVTGVFLMVAMGIDFDLGELASAMSPSNLIIALVIVIGAIVGSAFVGKLVGFYPIDTAITAGLCMANRGGSGDIAVLGAAHRLELISYAQLSSRLGGGIVLIIASFIFSFLL